MIFINIMKSKIRTRVRTNYFLAALNSKGNNEKINTYNILTVDDRSICRTKNL